MANLGWMGLAIPEEFGGSGFSMSELVVVVEELGRGVGPGPFVPTVITSSTLLACAPRELKDRLLAGLASGQTVGSFGLDADCEVRDGSIFGTVPAVLRSAIGALVGEDASAADIVDLAEAGIRRSRSMELPPEAETVRINVKAFAESVKGIEGDARLAALLDSSYAMPHWPEPWDRAAGGVEQLVIEQEFAAAGIRRPMYGITG
jgi:alkylation response protein AidB-like acyl-CoA dehydrogenase